MMSDFRLKAVDMLLSAVHILSSFCPNYEKMLLISCLNVVHMEDTSCQKAVRNLAR
jgi:hypothetical protein